MNFIHSSLSVLTHLTVTIILVLYIPLSILWKMVVFVFVRPFSVEEDLRGKVVLITGASSGIGEQLAYSYAKRGACLVLVARRAQALKVVAENATDQGAVDVLVIPADISSASESKRVIEETIAHFGKLDHLVANAGVAGYCLFEQVTNISAFKQLMDVNFWGAVYPTYYAIPHLKKSRGSIIVNASLSGHIPVAGISFYGASKAAVISFYETLRAELRSDVRITILMLGFVSSEMTDGKVMNRGGEIQVYEEYSAAVQIAPFPCGKAEECTEVIVESACRGDKCVVWPSWYRPFYIAKCLAPHLGNWLSSSFFVANRGPLRLRPGNSARSPRRRWRR